MLLRQGIARHALLPDRSLSRCHKGIDLSTPVYLWACWVGKRSRKIRCRCLHHAKAFKRYQTKPLSAPQDQVKHCQVQPSQAAHHDWMRQILSVAPDHFMESRPPTILEASGKKIIQY